MSRGTRLSTRREALKIAGAGVAGISTAIAGCVSGEDPDADQDGVWPPPRNLIEVLGIDDTTGTGTLMASIWMNQAERKGYFGDDITTTVTPGTEISSFNTLAEIDGSTETGTLAFSEVGQGVLAQITEPDVTNYDVADFIPLAQQGVETRGMQMNPRTLPIEDHFDLTWDAFVDIAVDEGVHAGSSGNPLHMLLHRLIVEWEPRLDEGDVEVTVFDGGGEARAALMRGEVDMYQGSFGGQFPRRNDIYLTQFALLDPNRYPERTEPYLDLEPEQGDRTLRDYPEAMLVNTSFPTDKAERLVDLYMDAGIYFAPPDMPESVRERYIEGFEQIINDDEVEEEVVEALSALQSVSAIGDSVEETAQNVYDSWHDDVVLGMIEELMD